MRYTTMHCSTDKFGKQKPGNKRITNCLTRSLRENKARRIKVHLFSRKDRAKQLVIRLLPGVCFPVLSGEQCIVYRIGRQLVFDVNFTI